MISNIDASLFVDIALLGFVLFVVWLTWILKK